MRILPLLFPLFMLICVPTRAAEGGHSVHKVILPKVKLAKSECVTQISITTTCARWFKINQIPNDWSVTAMNPVSEVSEFVAQTGHGSSAIRDFELLRRILEIRIVGSSCFDIKATVLIEDYVKESSRTVEITKGQIKLLP